MSAPEARDDEREFLTSHPTNGIPVGSPSRQEARDDEREALIALIDAALDPARPLTETSEGRDEVIPLLQKARVLLARKHPEPEVTMSASQRVTEVLGSDDWVIVHRGHELVTDAELDGMESKHPEREITDEMVRDALATYLHGETAGKTRAMRAALEAALRVPVEEGEWPVAAPAVSERIPGDELTVDSPSYSVRRFLSTLDGIASSDGEFSISAEHVDAGGTFTIHDSNGFPLWEMNLQGHPSDNDEAERLAE